MSSHVLELYEAAATRHPIMLAKFLGDGGNPMDFDSTCQIRRVNIRGDGRAQLDLKADNGMFDWSWFLSSADHANQVLAAALTAIATNRGVYCTISDPVQPWAEVVNFGVAR